MDSCSFLGSHVIRLFAVCGQLHEARHVFDMLPHPTVYSWSAIISASVIHGEGLEALDLYGRMILLGINPDGHTYVAGLKACTVLKDLLKGRLIHSDIILGGVEPGGFVGSSLIDMYVKCDDLEDAHKAFDQLEMQCVVAWSSLIFGYSQQERPQEALQLFQRMQLEGVVPNKVTYVCILKACASTEVELQAIILHACIVGASFDSDLFVGSILIDMYANFGRLDYARTTFEKLQNLDAAAWNSMIAANVQHACIQGAFQLYNQMRQEGVDPTPFTFVNILKACTINPSLDEGKRIHTHIIGLHLQSDLYVANALINIYCKFGDLDLACKVFENVQARNVVTWTTVLAGYAQHGHTWRAFQTFDKMQQDGINPHIVTFLSILKACANIQDVTRGKLIHSQIIEDEHELDIALTSSLVDMYAKCDSLDDAQEVFDKSQRKDVVSWNAIMGGYAQNGHCDKVLWLFSRMQQESMKPDIVTWNTMIWGFTQQSLSLEALHVFQQMQEQGINHENVTFVNILKACCGEAFLDYGRLIHGSTIEKGLELNQDIQQALLDMYIKCGSLEDAQSTFKKTEGVSIEAWNLLLSGYAQNEDNERQLKLLEKAQHYSLSADIISCPDFPGCINVDEALQVFNEMKQRGIVPDQTTFLSLLKCCSTVATLNQGRLIHGNIIESSLEQDVTICNALIDMYAKISSFRDAHQVFITSQERSLVTWNAIIAACAQDSKSDLAKISYERMQHEGLEPDSLTFVSLLRACSHVGTEEEGFYILNLMRSRHGVEPSFDHYTCLVDLLGRTGHLKEAEDLLETMPFTSSLMGWTSLLSHCSMHGSLALGRRCFEWAIKNECRHASNYTLMSSIYLQYGIDEGVDTIDSMKESANAWKKPGKAFIEVDNDVHAFSVQDKAHPHNSVVCAKLRMLNSHLKFAGYMPLLEVVLSLPSALSMG